MIGFIDDFNKLDTATLNSKLTYASELTNFLTAMFDYRNLPKTLERRFIERYLNFYGSVVIGEINGELYAVPPNLSGEIDAYNLGTTAFGVCPIGRVEGVRGVSVVWGLNDDCAMPTLAIGKTTNNLVELDKSIIAIVKNARVHPIPVAKDSKDKAMLDKIYKDIDDTEHTDTIVSSNLLNELEGAGEPFNVLNITDPTLSDKIQYLYHAKDDEYRLFYTRYGQAVQGTGKMAQQTEREIDGTTSVSFILPLQMLEHRKNMVAEINRIFNTNITVDFSPAWRVEYERFKEQTESTDDSTEESADGVADDSTDNDGGVEND